jgi:citrate synthase
MGAPQNLNRGTVTQSITVTDNRTGESREIPIVDGGVAANEWSKLLPGIWFYDPGFMSTAMAESAITYIDGDAGILRYRGYPIEQLAEKSTYVEVAYLFLHGELPNAEQAAAWAKRSRTTPTSTRTSASDSSRVSTTTRTPWACSSRPSRHSRPTTRKPRSSTTPRSLNKQIVRLIAKMPTLAAAAHRFSVGMPFVYPDNTMSYAQNFLSMMWKVAEPRYEPDPVLAHALDVLFILHADHEQNCGTTAMRVAGSSHADPYSATAAATAALYGPRHGGANEAVFKMLVKIGSVENVPAFVETVKQGKALLEGFGHRVYKNFDPRATIIKKIADDVLR